MSVTWAALSSELSKIAESEERNKKPSYLRAVVAGLPVVAAQALSDVPESIIERGVQNKILTSGGLPAAGKLVAIGPVRMASRIGAGALTTPLFVSGMKDIVEAKSKKDEKAGMGKILLAGGLYSGLRGGIESVIDTEYRHIPFRQRLQRVAGPKALRGLASAAATGYMVGRNIKAQKKDSTLTTRYVKPAILGAGMAGTAGLYEALLAEGYKTPEARRRVAAKVGGKAVAGAAATLFLSELMKKAIRGKEKKASQEPSPNSLVNTRTARWAKGATDAQLQDFYDSIMRRGGERSPSNRAALYAIHDEMTSRGKTLPQLTYRDKIVTESSGLGKMEAPLLASVVMAPAATFHALNTFLEPTDRDRVLSDALDQIYIQEKIEKVTHYTDPKSGEVVHLHRGQGAADLSNRRIYISEKADPAELAHEIGHIRAGKLRQKYLQSPTALNVGKSAAFASTLVPIVAIGSASDRAFSTKEELESKAKALTVFGAVAAAAQAPLIAEEATASAKALGYLARAGASSSEVAGKGAKLLLPAFGTYAAPALVPFVAASILRRRASHKKDQS